MMRNRQTTKTLSEKFRDGLRAIFTTTKAESDAQLAAEAEQRKQRETKTK
jgi:hypothetical protein